MQAALGYNLTQTLFVGSNNVLVEGVTDYWYLTAASDFLADSGEGLVDGIVLTPCGGAHKVGYMVALLTAQKLNVVVVLDSDGAGDDAAKELLTSKLIRDTSIVRVGAAVSPTAEADSEDLLEPSVFDDLVKEAYQKELKGKTLTLNANIPRSSAVTRRRSTRSVWVQQDARGELFLMKMAGKSASAFFPPSTAARFKDVISGINRAVSMVRGSGRKPFET